MVCYVVPMAAAIAHFTLRRNIADWKGNIRHLWLNLLFAGAAIFGVVDHWWNGELLLIGENILTDIVLGVTITITIVFVWIIINALEKSKVKKPVKS
ncbi:MAG: hypothetical protein JSW62_04510 [Thermoplasmatales archaeon]|nr:MAG: hypothetical protein JSW62_04510 [Thermoplasmatales archaeon]